MSVIKSIKFGCFERRLNAFTLPSLYMYEVESHPVIAWNCGNTWNLFIQESEALTATHPKNAAWIFDGMAILRSVKPKNTYREWLLQVLKTVTPDKAVHPKKIEVVFDNYSENSTNIGYREKWGTSARRVHLQGVGQKQLQGKEWQEFFKNAVNKEKLINLTVVYYRSPSVSGTAENTPCCYWQRWILANWENWCH